MRSRSFRPALIPTLAMLVASGVTARLGIWQLDRYGQAKERVTAVDVTLELEPLGVDDLSGSAESMAWRRARVEGHFEGEPYVATGGIPFGQNGYAVIEPLRIEGRGSLLVLRGWIPSQDWVHHMESTRVEGPVELHGVLREIVGEANVTPVRLPGDERDVWPLEQETFLGVFTRGVEIPFASIAADRGGDLLPVYLIAGEELEDGEDRNIHRLPAEGYFIKRSIFYHIEYAGQWFVMALIALGLWGWHGVRRGRARREDG